MREAGGREGLPSLSEKIKLLQAVRRQPDGSPWRGPTDIRAGLLALSGGLVEVDYSVSMIAKVINGKQREPAALLLAGLAALFDVPADYLLPPVSDHAVEITAEVHKRLLHELKTAAAPVPADAPDEPAAIEAGPDWTAWTLDLTLGVRRIAEDIAAELQITAGQAEILLHLVSSAEPSVSITEMTDLCRISLKTASTSSDALEEKGLLQRHERHLGERRNVRRLALTDHAREIVAKHTRPPATGQHVLDGMSDEDLAAARRLLSLVAGRAGSVGDDAHGGPDAGTRPEPPVTSSALGVA
ncbi:MAG: hypothetical protein QOF58_4007 [Pseudonocardiales bacterium]|nr:hypothetical protein [Pseudonocardiales bacterium]